MISIQSMSDVERSHYEAACAMPRDRLEQAILRDEARGTPPARERLHIYREVLRIKLDVEAARERLAGAPATELLPPLPGVDAFARAAVTLP